MITDAMSVGSTASIETSESGDDPLASPLDGGEYRILAETLDEKSDSSNSRSSEVFLSNMKSDASYGVRLTEEEAAAAVPPGSDGLLRHSIIIPDNFCSKGKLVGGLNPRDFDIEKGTIKPRRPSLPMTQSQLLSSLTKIDGPDGPRYIFNGMLNGWPSLRNFELLELKQKRTLGPLTPPDYLNSIRHAWKDYWSAEKEGKAGVSPAIRDKSKIYLAKLRGPSWTSVGYSAESPGFFFWFESQRPEGPRVKYGLQAIDAVGDGKCTMVHMISHRYATPKESPKDKLTYHSIVLLEWDHGKFCTVVEGAYLNGIGGYKGRSNWYHDKDEPVCLLYKALPPEMISPWLTTAAEIRAFDVEAKNLDEFKEFIEKYNAPDKRFLDPQYTFSHPARLTFRSRSNIAQYLINYIARDCSYSEMTRNCQTLAADLCAFLAGKKKVVPYHPINRIDYRNRTHFFIYDSDMYHSHKKDHLKGKFAK